MSRPGTAAPVLELREVHKSFGGTPIIRGVNLAVKRGQRPAEVANDFGQDRVRANSHSNSVKTGGDNFGNNFSTRQDYRERPRPEALG